jgi:hypothetical protein
MSDDPLDQLSARLFEALREEPTPKGAERRALERARRAWPARGSRRVTQLLLLAAAFAIAVGFAASRRGAQSSISAEPPVPSRRDTGNHAPAQPPPVQTPGSAPVEAPSAAPPKPKSVASVPRPASPSLDDELTSLKAAESALSAGDARTALELLDRYDAAKGQRMRAEATLLRIEALSRAGEPAAASALAKAFVAGNPGSPLVDRARSYVLVGGQHVE